MGELDRGRNPPLACRPGRNGRTPPSRGAKGRPLEGRAQGDAPAPNRELWLAYVLPYATYVLALSLPLERAVAYALAGSGAVVACAFAWRAYRPLIGPRAPLASVLYGAAAGAVGLALWIALTTPFRDSPAPGWDPWAFGLRALAASLVVPLFEEQLMRGFVLGLTVQWSRARRSGERDALAHAFDTQSVLALEPGACTTSAVAISSLAFALGHAPAEWLAAAAYGAGMAGLHAWRRDLLSCVIAHGVTNAGLAAFVRATGRWELW